MKKTKKVISSLLMIIIMLISFCVPAVAATTEEETFVEIPIVTVYGNNSETPTAIILSDAAKTPMLSSENTEVYTSVIRSGNTERCEVYLTWSGTDLYNSFRFKSLTIKSPSFLFPHDYGVFGNDISYSKYNFPAASVGSVYVGVVSIPTDVDQVRSEANDFQGFNINTDSWISAEEFSDLVTIN